MADPIERLERASFLLGCPLRAPSVGDIVCDLCRSDYGAAAVAHWRYRERYLQSLAVLVLTDRLVTVDAFTRAELGEDFGLFMLKLIRDQLQDRLSDHLL